MLCPAIDVTTSATRLEFEPDETPRAQCAKCQAPLQIHQPEPSIPDRFLGTCARCRSWYFISCTADRTEGVMVLLPTLDALQKALTEQKG
jgi:hypothetical protein